MNYDLPPIKGIDWEKAYHYMPSKDVLVEVLKEFVSSSEEQIEKLSFFKESLEKLPSYENFNSYRIQAHAMKAGLRSIGSELFDPALRLETAGKECDIEVIKSDTDVFNEKYRALAKELEVIVGKDKGPVAYDEELFFDRIDKIESAMGVFDISLLQNSIKDIKDMLIPDKYVSELSLLETAVWDLASEDVMASCARIKCIRGVGQV